jgi:hypothetical protein
MEHCLYEFHFVYWVQKLVHVDWVGRVDFFDWVDRLIWECAGDRLISECAEYHVGTFVVGSDGTWAAVGFSFISHRGRRGRGGNTPPTSLHGAAGAVQSPCGSVYTSYFTSDFRLHFRLPTSLPTSDFTLPTSSGRPCMAQQAQYNLRAVGYFILPTSLHASDFILPTS